MRAFHCDTDSASECFAALLDGLRTTGTELYGTHGQVAALISAALDVVSPDNSQARDDAYGLSLEFDVMAEILCEGVCDADYPDDDEEEL